MALISEKANAAAGFDRAAHAQAMVGRGARLDDGYVVNREKIREYARAVQDYHPVHWNQWAAYEFGYAGIIAPSTFASIIAIHAQARLLEALALGYGLDELVQTDQVIEFHRPITVDDRLSCEVYLHSWRRAFGGDLITTRTILTDQRNRLVLETYTSFVARSDGIRRDRPTLARGQAIWPHGLAGDCEPTVTRLHAAPAAALSGCGVPIPLSGQYSRRFDDVSVGQELPPRTVSLTLGDLVNYAGVSGDTNPIHWDRATAQSFGFDTVVAHGMLTVGLAAGFLTSWLGDPGAVRGLSVRMTSPVRVTECTAGRIHFTGKVKSMDPHTKTAVTAITAEHAGRRIFGRATATIQLF